MYSADFPTSGEKMALLAESYDFPAFILDKDLKIVYKNSFCTGHHYRFRLGSGLKNYVPLSDYRRAVQMKCGGFEYINIEMPKYSGAFLFRGEDAFLAGSRVLSENLQKRLDEIMLVNKNELRAIGYQIIETERKNPPAKYVRLSKHKLLCLQRAVEHFSDFSSLMRLVRPRNERPLEITELIKEVFETTRSRLRPLGVNLFGTNGGPRGIVSKLNESDFIMVLCMILNNCVAYSEKKHISMDFNYTNGRFYIFIESDTFLPEETVKKICGGSYEKSSLGGSYGWLFFDFLLVCLFCDFYSWEFRAVSAGFGRISYALSVPAEKKTDEELGLRSGNKPQKEMNDIVRLEFAPLFDTE